jgi:hypothetical protein
VDVPALVAAWKLTGEARYAASLLFAGLAFQEPSYLEPWRRLPADSSVDEVIRNFLIRQPVLWFDGTVARFSR